MCSCSRSCFDCERRVNKIEKEGRKPAGLSFVIFHLVQRTDNALNKKIGGIWKVKTAAGFKVRVISLAVLPPTVGHVMLIQPISK